MLYVQVHDRVCVCVCVSVFILYTKKLISLIYKFLFFCSLDQVFGCNLSSLCQRENNTVPKFVKLCIEHVEEHGRKKLLTGF